MSAVAKLPADIPTVTLSLAALKSQLPQCEADLSRASWPRISC